MLKERALGFVLPMITVLMAAWIIMGSNGKAVTATPGQITEGSLFVLGADGEGTSTCPLKHTRVQAEISGFLARVNVTQQFENPLEEKIEAVYTFPLPQDAAVDDMVMRIGDRTIRGTIKQREEARAIYEAARNAGHVASLLDQERPNIFTQSVANIMPNATITITISYVEMLRYEEGSYQFVFPMVVGPRYIPGTPKGKQGGGWAPDTDRVPDASRVTPLVTPEGTRSGHDIALEVTLDAGVPITDVRSTLHEIEAIRPTPSRAVVRLKDRATIPNRDFILRYDVAGRDIQDALLTHKGREGGFFTLILQPPARVSAEEVTPKELVFVLDTSGSMSGFPIEKAKETMRLALDNLYPPDTFNLITFSGDTRILFPHPVPASRQNLRLAQEFLTSQQGSGGTEMMKAIRAALDSSDAQDHVRIVCFMTDGYVGNDLEIIAEIQRHPNARVFAFGIGNAVNHFLLDRMAECGRGEVEYVTLQDDGSAAARKFHERIRNPLLTDVSINWEGLPVADVYPRRIPDLFSAKPVILSGRYLGQARGQIRLSGNLAGQSFSRELEVLFPDSEPQHDVLATLWARRRVDDLMSGDYDGIQSGEPRPDIKEAITQIGLQYRLMTQYTSFVAVEETIITEGGQPRRIDVPVEMPEGVSYQGVFGTEEMNIVAGRMGGMTSRAPIAVMSGVLARQAAKTSSPVLIVPPSPPHSTVVARPAHRLQDTELKEDANCGKLTPQEAEREALIAKLHPAIASLVEGLQKGARQSVENNSLIKDGKVELKVWLTVKSSEVLHQLKQLGFEVILNSPSSSLIMGRISWEKLTELAKLQTVRFIAPLVDSK